jgi:chitinase
MASTAHAVVPPSSSSNTSLTGYWQNFTNPAETPVKLTDIPSGYKIVIIAFADMNSDGSVSFTLQGPPYDTLGEDQFKADIKTIQARGVKVLISLGGQNGIYQVDTTAKEKNYISSLSQIITTYGFDGIDYDFESGLSTANESYLLDATLQLKQLFNKLIVTMAPETIDVYWQVFPNGKYDQLIRTAGLVDLVEVQDYNSGCMPGIKPGSACYSVGTEDFIVSQADSTIQAWTQSGIANAASHYVIGLPATSQAAGSGYVDPSILNSALTCLKTGKECGTYLPTKTYPDIAGVMTWSINWDAKNNYAFEKAVAG